MSTWRQYWDGDSPIYVNARHKRLHDERVAADIAALVPVPDAVVLDHGCGDTTTADILAARCRKLHLCDGAPTVRQKLNARWIADGRIEVLAPEDIEARLPDGSLDMVVANSLLQYLSAEDLAGLLELWRRKLKPGGRLVLGDVIPPDVSPVTDALALLRFAWKGGFLIAAAFGLVRTVFSDYRALRAKLGLTTWTEAAMTALLTEKGYRPTRHRANIGHNQARMTFLATRM